MLDFEFDGSLDFGEEEEKPVDLQKDPKKRVAVQHRYGNRHISRKASSEQALLDSLDWHFEEGDCYHCFSFGNVDSMSYFKHVLRQQRVLYLALSTWCMAGEDVDDLREWHRRGMLGRVDFFMGEIFQGSYPEVYAAVNDFVEEARKAGGFPEPQQSHGDNRRAFRLPYRELRQRQHQPPKREYGLNRRPEPGGGLRRAVQRDPILRYHQEGRRTIPDTRR